MLSRRGFILSGAAVTGGLVIGYGYVALDDGDSRAKFAASGRTAAPLNAWLKIAPDGTVICGVHRAEMGQGIVTTLGMLLAEELDADWNSMDFEFVPVDRDYYNFGMLLNGQPLGDPTASWGAATGTWAMRQVFHALGMSMTISSSSTVDAWDTLRPAGAAARQMLLSAAANEWQVDKNTLTTAQGFVIDAANGRRLSYGQLAEAASQIAPPDTVELKDRSQYRLIGTNPPSLDTRAKITGKAQFGIDVELPDLLYATVVHSPVAGTLVESYAADTAMDMPGVHGVYPAGAPGLVHAVAVVADDSWQALQAAKTVTVTAAATREPADSQVLKPAYEDLLSAPAIVTFTDTVAERNDAGDEDNAPDFDTVMASHGGTEFTADYAVPFLAHACMEPMNCTALYTGDALEIWAPTQANSISRDVAAKQAGLTNEQVKLHTTFMGGGFGRRAEMDFIEQAVSVAMQIPGRPIKLFWSREQDIRHDAYRPAAAGRFTGQVTAEGELATLDYTLVTQSVVASYETRTPTPRGATAETDNSVVEAINPPVYSVENLRLNFIPVDLHVPAGYWRSMAHSWTTFFMESFIDELALASNLAPLQFRRNLLKNRPRHLAVLNTVVDQIDVADRDRMGFSIAESHGTVVAHAIEVATSDNNFAGVTRVISAVDCGPAVHPDNVIAQMEGSIVDGLSAALFGQLDISDGQVQQGNFDSYRRLKLAECPTIDVHIVESEQQRPGGVGEPGVPGVAPALTNAIYAATGQRIRSLPISAVR